VNINTADEAALTSLPGIGQTRAAAIIAYREKHGPFSDARDLMQVSGIGESLFAQLEDKVTIN
jgi:competence protein ComEA